MTLDQAIPAATGVCLGIGALAKTWPRFPNAYIPTLVSLIGIVVVCGLAGWAWMHAVSGFVAGLGATGIHAGTRSVVHDVKERRGNTEHLSKP